MPSGFAVAGKLHFFSKIVSCFGCVYNGHCFYCYDFVKVYIFVSYSKRMKAKISLKRTSRGREIKEIFNKNTLVFAMYMCTQKL